MVELTDREKKIVHMITTMLNPALKDVPFNIKTKALQSVLLVAGFRWDEEEATDMMQAIDMQIKAGSQAAMGMLGKYGHLLKGLDKL